MKSFNTFSLCSSDTKIHSTHSTQYTFYSSKSNTISFNITHKKTIVLLLINPSKTHLFIQHYLFRHNDPIKSFVHRILIYSSNTRHFHPILIIIHYFYSIHPILLYLSSSPPFIQSFLFIQNYITYLSNSNLSIQYYSSNTTLFFQYYSFHPITKFFQYYSIFSMPPYSYISTLFNR